jgi:excisionase family DNA binding protein
MLNLEDAVTTAEAAKMLGVDPRTVQRRAERGQLEILAKLPGSTGAYLFTREAIEAAA